ncbi:MAG: hypothetical protein HKN80_12065 [Acidimicrobiia bacterium]|nr:hypothetical protein [Acidimicrobiia bacterium]
MNAFTPEITTAIAIERRHAADEFHRTHALGRRRRLRPLTLRRVEQREVPVVQTSRHPAHA